MVDRTDPTIMAGKGVYTTISTRGIGFAPQKQEDLVQPPAWQEQEIEAQTQETPRRVGNAAMKAASRQQD